MSELPFGFRPGGESGGSGSGGAGSGGAGSGSGGGVDPFGLGAMGLPGGGGLFAELEKLMSWRGGPINWDLARQLAVRVATEGDAAVGAAEQGAAAGAARLADVWLDPVTTLPAGASSGAAWSRVQWVEATLAQWARLIDPIAAKVVGSMGTALPEEIKAAAGPMVGIMDQVGGLIFGAQIGQALGSLAREVLSSTEVGLPLGPDGVTALVPTNVAAFGSGLGVPQDQVRLYLALREAAHVRLFAHVPWLRGHVLEAVEAYARGIEIDPTAIQRALGEIDPTSMDPEALQRALGGGLFEPQTSPAQQAALARLETVLALIEGWVDEVVDAAAAPHLPATTALRETVRRRRASGGPAEQTFATLVGLELRPRRLREAAALWRAVTDARGIEGRDAVWDHPDLLPGSSDLDDPAAFAAGGAGADLDAELRSLGTTEPGPSESADAPPDVPGPEADDPPGAGRDH